MIRSVTKVITRNMNKQDLEDRAGFSDAAFQEVVGNLECRNPEQIHDDEEWIRKTTQEIINRRKAKNNAQSR